MHRSVAAMERNPLGPQLARHLPWRKSPEATNLADFRSALRLRAAIKRPYRSANRRTRVSAHAVRTTGWEGAPALASRADPSWVPYTIDATGARRTRAPVPVALELNTRLQQLCAQVVSGPIARRHVSGKAPAAIGRTVEFEILQRWEDLVAGLTVIRAHSDVSPFLGRAAGFLTQPPEA
jgi:hypothetical protein